MGSQKVLRTYGHHRKRCVVSIETANIFHCGIDSKQHVFSNSSSESGLGPSGSFDSADPSPQTSFTGRRAKEKALFRLQSGGPECTDSKKNKRKRQPRQEMGKLFTTDKDTCSSSDCTTPAAKRVITRALRNVSNISETRKPGKRRQKRSRSPALEKNQNSVNFSEFDDYSLIISDSPLAEDAPINFKSGTTSLKVGTSTPCSTDNYGFQVDVNTVDVSSISAFSVSVDIKNNKYNSFSLYSSSEGDASLLQASSPQWTDNEASNKGDNCEEGNLKRLEQSFASMRVVSRRLRSRKSPVEQRSQCCEKSLEPISKSCSSDDPLVTECKNRVQKLKESLIFGSFEILDSSRQDDFDPSCNLFDSSHHMELRSSSRQKLSLMDGRNSTVSEDHLNSSEFDSDQECEDLSAIMEDGEDAEEENEYSEDESLSSDINIQPCSISHSPEKTNSSSSLVPESSEEGSPVYYTLASLPDTEDVPIDMAIWSEEDSDLSGKKSPVPSQTRSFAEVLTPSKEMSTNGVELSSREKVLQQCCQSEPLPFSKALTASVLKKCVKVGEGVYGEVFRTTHKGESVALKIIPIEGNFEVNDEQQKTFEEILPEIVISGELSRLQEGKDNNTSNFCPVKSVSLVQGQYPSELLKQWDIFHAKKHSENDRPDIFGEDQLFIMFEFGDGGIDLDMCKLKNAAQAVSVIQQVACALAVAEEVLQFEHRDLHVGNVLVKPTPNAKVMLTLNNNPIFINTQGIHVSIIDFTLSRLTKDGCTVYCDLSTDDTLFEGKGDYQFDIYRMMKEENKNGWEQYHPYTNVLWLHYLCHKLIQHKGFLERNQSHRDSLRQLREVHSRLKEYCSASHFVLEDSLFISEP